MIQPSTSPASQWLDVTELNEQIRDLLEETYPYVRVKGEISDLSQPPSGHVYFTLIDKKSRIRAVLWRGTRRRIPMKIKPGDGIKVTGRIALYPPRGEYQIVIEAMQPMGAGTERERFLELFERLKEEGLFDDSRKRAFPLLPETIGVVTSTSGAALHDIMKVLDNRFPGYHLIVCHARVQGIEAPGEIASALNLLNQDGRSQVILCGRGGGSSEDLAAFNSEIVARAIATSSIPVISAVGHEVDLTLADLAADSRAPTPSAAAEQVMPEKKVLVNHLNQLIQRLLRATQLHLEARRKHIKQLDQRLIHPQRSLEQTRMRCDELNQRVALKFQQLFKSKSQKLSTLQQRLPTWSKGAALNLIQNRLTHAHKTLLWNTHHQLDHKRERVNNLKTRLMSLSPMAVLQRGYAIVHTDNDTVVRQTHNLRVGENIKVILSQGKLQASITELTKMKE